jgi:predicted metalloprotease with PDZ domain
MLYYTFYQKNPASHYIYVDLKIEGIITPQLKIHLPVWRPGRYEWGHFAKHIKKLEARDIQGNTLQCNKHAPSSWIINTTTCTEVFISYSYYAAEYNAGACYANAELLYINPVHCCLWAEGFETKAHFLRFQIPEQFKIATALPLQADNWYKAETFDELADSPVVCGLQLQQYSYTVQSTRFFIHFSGSCSPDWIKIKSHFEAFTQTQIQFWGSIPVTTFHFLVLLLPFKFYHGVEHLKSTVLALGPADQLNDSLYDDFLGVASHELFHVWNIKTLRPASLLPYDFLNAQYSNCGAIYEGFTTYYGDKLLYASGVFSWNQFKRCIEERLQKHVHNYGRFNISLAETSIDTWLDGYVPGAPYRKTSIYDEGSIMAFMLDSTIYFNSNGCYTLADVLRYAYQSKARTQGYTLEDLADWIQQACAIDLRQTLHKWLHTAFDFQNVVQQQWARFGVELQYLPALQNTERRYGFTLTDLTVSRVAPYSPAWKAGLFNNTRIVALNGIEAGDDLQWQFEQQSLQQQTLVLHVFQEHSARTCSITVKPQSTHYYPLPELQISNQALFDQHQHFFKR